MKSPGSFFYLLFFCFPLLLNAQTTVSFSVEVPAEVAGSGALGLRGSLPPLSWEKTYPLSDPDGDGRFTATIVFPNPEQALFLSYKYVYGDVTWELADGGNRITLLDQTTITLPAETWDQPRKIEGLEQRRIPSEKLIQDYTIVEQAFTQIHPGLYRYNDEASIRMHLRSLKADLGRDLTIGEAYLAFSKFLGEIRCGHTYANFFNQNALVRQVILEQSDKLPFAHRIVDGRLIVTKNGSPDKRLAAGTEILSINGVPMAAILDSLVQVVKADGANDAKRLNDLQVWGYDSYESFDVYFPLFFPPREGRYTIRARHLITGEEWESTVAGLTRQDRRARLEERYGALPDSYDDLWEFRVLDERAAYLKLGTFVTWQMETDWKAFLKDAFREVAKKDIPNLIIDVRDNEGGADEVLRELSRHLVREDFTYRGWAERARCARIPAELRPYLDTWDKSVFEPNQELVPTGNGYFTWKDPAPLTRTVKGTKKAYAGKVYFLVNAANSSATFFLADYVRQGKLGTLVGQPTGGSRRGINGGTLLFVRLPHSLVELDLPIMGNFAPDEQPDRGIEPDIFVAPSAEDVARGVDTELEAVLGLIRR